MGGLTWPACVAASGPTHTKHRLHTQHCVRQKKPGGMGTHIIGSLGAVRGSYRGLECWCRGLREVSIYATEVVPLQPLVHSPSTSNTRALLSPPLLCCFWLPPVAPSLAPDGGVRCLPTQCQHQGHATGYHIGPSHTLSPPLPAPLVWCWK